MRKSIRWYTTLLRDLKIKIATDREDKKDTVPEVVGTMTKTGLEKTNGGTFSDGDDVILAKVALKYE